LFPTLLARKSLFHFLFLSGFLFLFLRRRCRFSLLGRIVDVELNAW